MAEPFEFTPPEDQEAFDPFVDGEMVLTPTEGDAPGETTFYLARRIDWPAGRYTLKCYVDDAFTMWVGRDQQSTRMVHNSGLVDGPVITEFQVFESETRLDIYLQNTTAGDSPCYVVFSIFRDGQLIYASSADGWESSTDPIPDSALPGAVDPRLLMPIFSFMPNWKNGVTEQLTWLSEVLESESGYEQRRALRLRPHRTLEAGFLRKGRLRSRLENFIIGVGKRRCMVPLWQEQFRSAIAIVGDEMTYAGLVDGNDWREFTVGDVVLVTNGDPENYDLAVIADISGETITWSVAPPRSWPTGTRLIPMRQARIMDQAEMNNVTENVGTAQIRFELEPDYFFDEDVRPNDNFIELSAMFQFKPNRAAPLTLGTDRVTFEVDNHVAEPFVTDTTDQARPGLRLSLTLFKRRRVFAFRKFLKITRGRTQRFWCGSHTNDLTLISQDPDDGSLLVHSSGMTATMFVKQHARHWLLVRYDLGDDVSGEPVEIDRVEAEGDNERIFLVENRIVPDVPLAANLEFIFPVRFDQDTFDLHHHVDSSAAVTTQVLMRVVDSVDMVEPQFVGYDYFFN